MSNLSPLGRSTPFACLALASGILLEGCQSDGPVYDVLPDLPVVAVQLDTIRSIRTSPLFSVGGTAEPPHSPLHRVEDALILESGGLVIANRGSHSLLFFDERGVFSHEAGREGEGPGEYQILRSLHRGGGDSILVWDAVANRITAVSGNGEVIATAPLPQNGVPGSEHSGYKALDVYGQQGALLMVQRPLGDGRAEPGVGRDSRFVALVDRQGKALASIGLRPGDEWIRSDQMGAPSPFSYRFHPAVTSSAVYIGNGRGPVLAEYGLTGEPQRRLALPIERRLLSEAEWDRARERYLDRLVPNLRDETRQLLNEGLQVDSFPAFTEILSASDDVLWVRLYDPPGVPQRWLVVDPVALEAVRVTLPADAELLDTTEDAIAFLVEDELDREIVHVRSLRRLPSDTASAH